MPSDLTSETDAVVPPDQPGTAEAMQRVDLHKAAVGLMQAVEQQQEHRRRLRMQRSLRPPRSAT